MKESQFKMILDALKRGEKITPLEALYRFGCFKLAARIFEMKSAGYDIKTKIVTDGKKHFAQYYLNQNKGGNA